MIPRAAAHAFLVALAGAALVPGPRAAASPGAPLPRLVVTDLDAPSNAEDPAMPLFLAEQVRGVALRRLSPRFSVAPLLAVQPQLPAGARCVAACRAAAAGRAGAAVALVGTLSPSAGGTSVRLQAVQLPARRVFAQAVRTDEDPVVAAVAAAEDLCDLVLAAPLSPPPPPPPIRGTRAPAHGFGGPGPSPLAALGLELLLPSSGLFYAGESGAGAFVLLGLGLGTGTTIAGIDRGSDTLAVVGVSLLLAARLGGLVAAPLLAADNRDAPRAALRAPSPPSLDLAPDAGLAPPPAPATWSWTGTF